jgi:hypothetical protein
VSRPILGYLVIVQALVKQLVEKIILHFGVNIWAHCIDEFGQTLFQGCLCLAFRTRIVGDEVMRIFQTPHCVLFGDMFLFQKWGIFNIT